MAYLTCLCFEAQTRGHDTEAAQCVSVVISTYFGLNSIALGFDAAAGDDRDFKGTWWVKPIKTGVRDKDQRMCQLKMSLQKKQLFANAAKACHKQIWTEMFACAKYSKKERAENTEKYWKSDKHESGCYDHYSCRFPSLGMVLNSLYIYWVYAVTIIHP